MRSITLFSTASEHFGTKEIFRISSQNYINKSPGDSSLSSYEQLLFAEALWMEAEFPPTMLCSTGHKDAQDQKWMLPKKVSYVHFSPYKRKQISVLPHTSFSCCYCPLFFWLCCETCVILVPNFPARDWICAQQWKHGILTAGPPGKSPYFLLL